MTNSINKRNSNNIDIFINNNVALGHTQLGIIDLLTNNKHISYEHNSNIYTIIYNGELYNLN